MKLGSIGRSLVRYFRPRATSASPQNGPARDLGGYTATVEYVGRTWPPPPPFSPASDPPKASEALPSVTPWAEWGEKLASHYTPSGWTFCKFGVRGADAGSLGYVHGIVRDGFGAYWCRFYVYVSDSHQAGEQFLAVGVNTRSGYAIGIFANLQEACEAIEIALRLSCRVGLDQNPDAPASDEAFRLLTQAFDAAGFVQGSVVCRPMVGIEVVQGPPIPVWIQSGAQMPVPGARLS